MYVPAGYTSQRCHQCRHTEQQDRDSQAGFCCRRCGHRDNADTNAARNIADSGMRVAKYPWQCTAVSDHKPCPNPRTSGDRSQKSTGSENQQTTQ